MFGVKCITLQSKFLKLGIEISKKLCFMYFFGDVYFFSCGYIKKQKKSITRTLKSKIMDRTHLTIEYESFG